MVRHNRRNIRWAWPLLVLMLLSLYGRIHVSTDHQTMEGPSLFKRFPGYRPLGSGPLVLLGVTYGYHELLQNMLCQLAFLGVDTYTIVAFDAETYSFCQLHDLQCVPASMDIWWSSVNGWLVSSSSSHQFEYGTQGFRDVSKLKCQQVLRALRAGYDVIWPTRRRSKDQSRHCHPIRCTRRAAPYKQYKFWVLLRRALQPDDCRI
ncbi:Nucleotide-diphospho-sugar transferase [Nannochloropsis gaditana]|uniref:Nucleotide-diphospho-sugar transferase n=1 Tax=Nannochloropsis gaditana TaxID=72520 RepID=W7TGU2_9STRA|nr:Nucleotide-diphospho-sugar transferase [Nannochloropsis gaditana]